MKLRDIPAIYLVDKLLVAAQGTIVVRSYSRILKLLKSHNLSHEYFIRWCQHIEFSDVLVECG